MRPLAAMLGNTTLLFAFERKKQKEGRRRKRKTLESQTHDLRDERNFKRANLVYCEESKVVLSPFYR